MHAWSKAFQMRRNIVKTTLKRRARFVNYAFLLVLSLGRS